MTKGKKKTKPKAKPTARSDKVLPEEDPAAKSNHVPAVDSPEAIPSEMEEIVDTNLLVEAETLAGVKETPTKNTTPTPAPSTSTTWPSCKN